MVFNPGMCVGFLFEALSVFSFVCWAAPTNVPVNQIFGIRTGLGFSVITFDWSQISWIGSPLMGMIFLIPWVVSLRLNPLSVPWWAELHIFLGFIMFFWILTPALYYSNVRLRSQSPPILILTMHMQYLVLETRILPYLWQRTIRQVRKRLQHHTRADHRRPFRPSGI
jgi:hypothetical protein